MCRFSQWPTAAGFGTSPNEIRVLYLPECLKRLADRPGPWLALQPLVVASLEQAQQEAATWRRRIRTLNIEESGIIFLEELLVRLILERFKHLSQKEIETMLELTPLRETRAGQELFDEGRDEGLDEGEKRGLTGQINLLEQLLNLPLTPLETVRVTNPADLTQRISQLEQRLRARLH